MSIIYLFCISGSNLSALWLWSSVVLFLLISIDLVFFCFCLPNLYLALFSSQHMDDAFGGQYGCKRVRSYSTPGVGVQFAGTEFAITFTLYVFLSN
ncbi:hypothetical protein ASPWEDRAFT_220241 [Aspergillus wentii DTO 134E9]|uniref:Uncharacterized protein n=1 Tax=Aspergillus wentii DTO 134E9 TaxID=1073089 RepID=A0A1L9S0C2_ASPWE|nr:uncharacterized protein ASPWEDRAFT_220241 [Aspergillus wentii DTO 134E9]OJJ40557.1 hypothetical protein ASPWEDRAFT_220241 [Aspergillus wentii DTO 134E9]